MPKHCSKLNLKAIYARHLLRSLITHGSISTGIKRREDLMKHPRSAPKMLEEPPSYATAPKLSFPSPSTLVCEQIPSPSRHSEELLAPKQSRRNRWAPDLYFLIVNSGTDCELHNKQLHKYSIHFVIRCLSRELTPSHPPPAHH